MKCEHSMIEIQYQVDGITEVMDYCKKCKLTEYEIILEEKVRKLENRINNNLEVIKRHELEDYLCGFGEKPDDYDM